MDSQIKLLRGSSNDESGFHEKLPAVLGMCALDKYENDRVRKIKLN